MCRASWDTLVELTVHEISSGRPPTLHRVFAADEARLPGKRVSVGGAWVEKIESKAQKIATAQENKRRDGYFVPQQTEARDRLVEILELDASVADFELAVQAFDVLTFARDKIDEISEDAPELELAEIASITTTDGVAITSMKVADGTLGPEVAL